MHGELNRSFAELQRLLDSLDNKPIDWRQEWLTGNMPTVEMNRETAPELFSDPYKYSNGELIVDELPNDYYNYD